MGIRTRKNILRRLILPVVAVAAVIGGGVLFGGDITTALREYGPDASYFQNNARYALENSGSTSGTTQLSVPIYIKSGSRPGSVGIQLNRFSYWGNQRKDGNRYRLDYGSRNVLPGYQYRVNGSGGWTSCAYPAPGSTRNFTIAGSKFVMDNASGMWKATLNIQMCNAWSRQNKFDGNLVNFNVKITSPSVKRYVGFSPQGSGKYIATANNSPKSGDFYTYRIPIALPCDKRAGSSMYIDFYDLDDRNSDNGGRAVNVTVRDASNRVMNNVSYSGSKGSNKNYRVRVNNVNPGQKYTVELKTIYSRNVLVYNPEYDNISYITECNNWSINGQSYIRKNSQARGQTNITAAPGDAIRWDHDLRNRGPNNMNRNVNVVVDRLDYSLANGSQLSSLTDQHGNRRGTVNELFYETNNTYVIPQSKVGQRLCQRIAWNPQSSSQGGWGRSTMRCVSIPYDYNLIPSVTSPAGGEVVQRGGEVDVTGNINNTGSTQTRNDIQWRLTEVVFPGDANLSSFSTVRTSTQDPCRYLANNRSCTDNVERRSGDTIERGGVNARGEKTRQIPDDMETDDRICWMLSVRPYAHNAPAATWRHSAIVCNTVGKQPKVQIHGGDVRAGATYSGSSSEINANIITASTTMRKNDRRIIYGSWGEYGLFAKNSISSSSGAGLSSDKDGRSYSSDPRTYNPLTFANTPNFGTFSNDMGSIRDPQDYFAGDPQQLNSSTVNVGSLNGSYKRSGPITLTGGTVGKGKTVVIEASDTVTISNNVQYGGGSYGSIGDLPQLIIIAPDIVVRSNVTRVDAWLIAKNTATTDTRTSGRLSTCNAEYNYSTSLAGKNCDKRLEMNGPVMTQNIFLRRTSGAERSNPGTPAEVINLRPDAYLWGRGQAIESGAIQTMHVRDKPPRL